MPKGSAQFEPVGTITLMAELNEPGDTAVTGAALTGSDGRRSAPGRHRLVAWDDPLAGAALSAQLSGLEFLQMIIDGQVPPPPIALLLGMRLVEVGRGQAVFTLDVGEHLYNPIGSVHGGICGTLLDSAMGCAVHSTLPQGKGYTTLELKVNLVKALNLATPEVRCEGRVLSSGRRVATASAQILGPDRTLFAHATTTCLIFDYPPVGEQEEVVVE
jgi:uncharacterized protein (TIGR00369 family)